MVTLSWTTSIQVQGQPIITVERDPRAIEAQDFVQVTLPPGATDVAVAIQPGAVARVRLLAIRADAYSDDLTFKVSDGADDTDALALDEPQLFAGSAITLFGLNPTILRLSNGGADPATIEVFAFRDAAP
jgi:hypothetical protein